jgi:hypothetical protein
MNDMNGGDAYIRELEEHKAHMETAYSTLQVERNTFFSEIIGCNETIDRQHEMAQQQAKTIKVLEAERDTLSALLAPNTIASLIAAMTKEKTDD